jgi:motility quorum-sensing regulator/GCU-specific mRNA interferase toxin
MEKRAPHYDLSWVQSEVAKAGVAAFTKTALDGGRLMGLTTAEMLVVVASLRGEIFISR